MEKVLIVDDEDTILSSLVGILEEEGYESHTAKTLKEAEKKIRENFYPVIVLDVWMPDGDGIVFIDKIRELSPDSIIVVITGHGSVELAVKAIKRGAYEFIEKPFSVERFLLTIKHAYEEFRKSKVLDEDIELIGNHPKIEKVKRLIPKIARSKTPILIQGESGTGKEIVAKLIHKYSGRKGLFVDINCAALPLELLESELFGYERGAFTGAISRKKGKLELADGGTLFLDEIGELEPRAQAKLLRVLETGSFTRLGGTQKIEVDVRVISATNKDLRAEVKKGNFREDLFYRISVFTLTLPPLRERGEDIILLAEYFLKKFAKEYKKPCYKLTESAKEKLLRHTWKGNVRELKNLIERVVILCEKGEISAEDLGLLEESYNNLSFLLEIKNFKEAKKEFERVYLTKKLKEYNYNLKEVAKNIGLDLSNLYRKIKALGLTIHQD